MVDRLDLDDHFGMVDLYQHPFEAQQDYGQWGDMAGLISSTALASVHKAERGGIQITTDDEVLLNANAMPVIRSFSEFGYNSRLVDTAVVTSSDIWEMMGHVLDKDDLKALRDAPAIIRGSLAKIAKEAFIWGRTGDARAGIKFGEESEAAEMPEIKGVFFEDDIRAFSDSIADKVEEVAYRELRKEIRPLGRLALRSKHRTFGIKQGITRRQWLHFNVGVTVSNEAREFIKDVNDHPDEES
jgi:hypothetical protein